ncbi:MAG TPA: HAD family hydrolase [Phycisphaerae bacterium]
MQPLVFLLDVDNTLLDNDRVTADLKAHLMATLGAAAQSQYWKYFEEIRKQLGYADYLGALQRYRMENPREPNFLGISSFLLSYPFPTRLFPGALEAIKHLSQFGPTVVLSDGDVVFQPWKVERSGILAAVQNRVLIYIHKELELADVEARYPAAHYVFVDDKLRLHTAIKKIWGAKVTTIFVRQGHYALDPEIVRSNPPADMTIEHIGDLQTFERGQFAAR